MPGQIKRLLFIFAVVGLVFIISRQLFIPETFGKYGHYRAAAVDSSQSLPINYSGHLICLDCHDEVHSAKENSRHQGVNCEACHGPTSAHLASLEADDLVVPFIPLERSHCNQCHAYDPAKPNGFPQIDQNAHYPVKACLSCHNPHAPKPSEAPGKCSACHTGIMQTKALSPHSELECTVCHVTPEAHSTNPRSIRPGKPQSRADCGTCHGENSESDRHTKKVDLTTHGDGYLCWQCHYPHYPETN